MNAQCQMERYKLFQWINMVSFAVNDITLYLDTHPDDQQALDYFNHFKALRTDALKEYASKYTPLTIDTATPENYWTWWSSEMPWEGGVF